MAEIQWIKLATNIFDNRKVKQIEKMDNGDSIITIWFKLLCLAGITNDRGLIYLTPKVPFTNEMLAVEFDRPEQLVSQALDVFLSFDMIRIEDGYIALSSWEKYQNTESLLRIQEQNRERKRRQRERQAMDVASKNNIENEHANVTCHVTQRDTSVTVTQQNKNKSKNKNINSAFSSKDAQSFFESVWKLYPNKKGKGQVSDAAKGRLQKVGYEQIKRCVERYLSDLAKESWRKPQNGSTFFNSGYVDYLDENYGNNLAAAKDDTPFLN